MEDDDNVDEALIIADLDWKRHLESIRNASFHEGFDGEIHNSTQRGFDDAWALMFEPAFVCGELNAIISLISKDRPDEASTYIKRLQNFMDSLMEVYKTNKDIKDMPNELRAEFEQIKSDIHSIKYD